MSSSEITPLPHGPQTAAFTAAFQRYQDQLPKEHEKLWGSSFHAACSLHDVVMAIRATENETFKKRSHRLFEQLQRISEPFRVAAPALDVLSQVNSGTLVPIWGPLRFVVLLVKCHSDLLSRISSMVESLLGSLCRIQRYEKIFPNSKEVQNTIIDIYAEAIGFCVATVSLYQDNTTKKLVRPLFHSKTNVKFESTLDRLDKKLRTIDPVALQEEIEESRNDRAANDTFKHSTLQRWKKEDAFSNDARATTVRRWLQPTDYESHLESRLRSRLPGTCDWIQQNEEFIAWSTSTTCQNPSLLVVGGPGYGKSILLSSVIEDLKAKGVPLVFFFFRASNTSQSSILGMLKDLVFQILKYADDSIFTDLFRIYQQSGRPEPSFAPLWEIFKSFVAKLPRLTCFVDAVDECMEDDESLLLSKLTELCQLSGCHFKLFATSRPDPPIVDELRDSGPIVHLTPAQLSDDVCSLISAKINASHKLSQTSVKDEVQRTLLKEANGSFLWVVLMVSELNRAPSVFDLKRKLRTLPPGLYGTYRQILLRMKATLSCEQMELAFSVLRYVLFATRPIKYSEFDHAFGIQKSPSKGVLNHDCLLFDCRAEIVTACGSLVEISADGSVSLVHLSLREFLLSLSKNDEDVFANSIFDQSSCNTIIAEASLDYLELDVWKASSNIPKSDATVAAYPFYEYAALNWSQHLASSEPASSIPIERVKRFFQSPQAFFWLNYLTGRLGRSVKDMLLVQSHLLAWQAKSQQPRNGEISILIRSLYTRKVEISISTHGQNDVKTARTVRNLGQLLLSLGKPEEALSHLKQALKGIPDGHESEIESLGILSELGTVHIAQGKYVEAEDLYRRVLAGHARIVGSRHIETLSVRARLAHVLLCRGKMEEGKDIILEVCHERESILGKLHPDTLDSLRELAMAYEGLGLYQEFKITSEKVYISTQHVLGQDHPDTLKSRATFAFALKGNNLLDEAYHHYEETLKRRIRVVGERHPDTQTCMMDMAIIQQEQGNLEASRTMDLRLLKIRMKDQGPRHPGTLTLQHHLAYVLQQQGQFAKAERLNRKVQKLQEEMLGPDHPHTLFSICDLGTVLRLQNKLHESRTWCEKAHSKRAEQFGERHRETLHSAYELGLTLLFSGALGEAEPLLTLATKYRCKFFGQTHSMSLQCQDALGLLRQARNEFVEARALHMKVLDIRVSESTHSPHPDLGLSYIYLGCLSLRQSQYQSAQHYFEKVRCLPSRCDKSRYDVLLSDFFGAVTAKHILVMKMAELPLLGYMGAVVMYCFFIIRREWYSWLTRNDPRQRIVFG